MAAFRATCSEYGISTSDNFYGIFGVTNREKRPDLIVYRGATREEPLVLDFTIPHQPEAYDSDAVNNMSNQKKRKYKDWFPEDVHVKPFVIATNTIPHPEAMDTIREVAKQAIRHGFVRECCARIKLAIINFSPYKRKAIQARKSAGTLDVTPVQDDDDAG